MTQRTIIFYYILHSSSAFGMMMTSQASDGSVISGIGGVPKAAPALKPVTIAKAASVAKAPMVAIAKAPTPKAPPASVAVPAQPAPAPKASVPVILQVMTGGNQPIVLQTTVEPGLDISALASMGVSIACEVKDLVVAESSRIQQIMGQTRDNAVADATRALDSGEGPAEESPARCVWCRKK